MLDDTEDVTLPDVPELEPIRSSYMHFYLTGSYYFGCPSLHSDIDFIAAEHGFMRQYLESSGFTPLLAREGIGEVERIELEHYEGTDILVEHRTLEVYQRGIVQVQLVDDVRFKRRARDLIKRHHWHWHKDASKEARTRLWHAYLQILSVDFHLLDRLDIAPTPLQPVDPDPVTAF